METSSIAGNVERNKSPLKNTLLTLLNGVCLPLFQTAPAKLGLAQYLRHALVLAEAAALCER